MACAALRARSMIYSSAERVMFTANSLNLYSLCVQGLYVKVIGRQKRKTRSQPCY